MGVGNSRERYGYNQIYRSPIRQNIVHREKRRIRSPLRRIRAAPTAQPVRRFQYSPHQFPYGSHHFVPPISTYSKPSPPFQYNLPKPYNNYGGYSYNNYAGYLNNNYAGYLNNSYAAYPYTPPKPPLMIPSPPPPVPPMLISPTQKIPPMVIPPPQRIQPLVPPQQLPQFPPIMLPQQVSEPQPMMMPQQIAPSISSPYVYSPYPMSMPMPPTPYPQQQPQAQPIINNIGISPPISPVMANPIMPSPVPFQGRTVNAFTDWTGGGKISPGFLGPPI
ncbi:unnamed protein product [Rotaria sp. Silwood1]|nr:unnamed protein product [Rotaria sp. Silwood1]CAF1212579.1 unnamed protein product [Rotaria sp. Silwood1]CAF3465130.1 unnamed protein product [Rotaria sp. Silwood1]CAF4905486.1 unnamed protein product [Rotaria sp. Silwood1]